MIRRFVFLILLIGAHHAAFSQKYLKRSLGSAPVVRANISSSTAHYAPLFGEGDDDAAVMKGVKRFGLLRIQPEGESKLVSFKTEEQVGYVIRGVGMMTYPGTKVPLAKNDYFYVPRGARFGFSNPREDTLEILLMGYTIPNETETRLTPGLMLANTDEVDAQVLGQHGPTTTFQLLLGTTRSRRDRLAAAYRINSLFTMNFAPGGTNIPHRHEREEEIYLLLNGSGEIVAGETSSGEEVRHSAKEGDAFYFAPGTLVGFYSNPDEANSRILAIRSKLLPE